MKTLVYWIGLILGFGICVSFIALWIYLASNSLYYLSFGNHTISAMLLMGAIIVIVIGWQMRREGR